MASPPAPRSGPDPGDDSSRASLASHASSQSNPGDLATFQAFLHEELAKERAAREEELMKERAAWEKKLTEERVKSEARDKEMFALIKDLKDLLKEKDAKVQEAQAEAKEAQAEAKEAQAEAKEAQAEAKEAQAENQRLENIMRFKVVASQARYGIHSVAPSNAEKGHVDKVADQADVSLCAASLALHALDRQDNDMMATVQGDLLDQVNALQRARTDRDAHEEAAKKLGTLVATFQTDKPLAPENEVALTSECAPIIDRYLTPEMVCMHQYRIVLNEIASTADLVVLHWKDRRVLAVFEFGISDAAAPGALTKKRYQLLTQAALMAEKNKSQRPDFVLGFSVIVHRRGTIVDLSAECVVVLPMVVDSKTTPRNGWTSVWSCHNSDPTNVFSRILRTLDARVAWKFDNPLPQALRGKVTIFVDKVYKVYKIDDSGRQRADAFIKYGTRLNPREILATDRVIVVEYDKADGLPFASQPIDFVPIITQLLALHKMGVCHGDVRGYNMVLGGQAGSLIDFDFSGEVGEAKYPDGLVLELPDLGKRPPGMVAGALLDTRHDWLSLAGVMKKHTLLEKRATNFWAGVIADMYEIANTEAQKRDHLIDELVKKKLNKDGRLTVGEDYHTAPNTGSDFAKKDHKV